jgi:HSP20 family protein
VEITAELPGVREEDIDITIDDGVLTLRGEKKSVREDKEAGYRERSYGSFERRITLPANIDEDACAADFKDGVLTITLPKSEEKARGRKIEFGRGKRRDTRAEDALIEQREQATRKEERSKEKENA